MKSSGGFFASLKTLYYNQTYSLKASSYEELTTMLAKDPKGNWLVNPQIRILDCVFPQRAHNWRELIDEIKQRNQHTVWFTYRKGFSVL